MDGPAAIRLIIFLLGSVGFVALSWGALKDPRSHGFYRFFTFEILWGMLLINAPYWFDDPFSGWQILSWALLLLSVVAAVQGFTLLKKVGKPEGKIEATTALVVEGLYRHIRHPLYGSLLLFGWGVFLKRITGPSAALILLLSVCMYATAKAEERENVDKFGAAYEMYMQESRMFIPFLI